MRRASVRWFLSLLGAVALALYVAFQARNLISGPTLALESPSAPQSVLEEAYFVVAGTARNTTALFLNGRPIFISPDGSFKEDLALPIGYTVLTVEAQDRFGRRTERTLEVWRIR